MAPTPPPYSPAMKAGNLVFISGQIALRDGEMVTDSFEAEVKQAFANLAEVIANNGALLSNIVKTTVFLTSIDNLTTMNELYGEFFADHWPARSTVAVAALPRGASFEIEAVVDVG